MEEIMGFIRSYYRSLSKSVLFTCTIFIAILIYLNFRFSHDQYISDKDSVFASFYHRYFLFFIAFALPYLIYNILEKKNYFKNPLFCFLVILAPAIFSWKMAMNSNFPISGQPDWNFYWNQIIYWPLNLIMITTLLFVIWIKFFRADSFFGFSVINFKWKPYLFMLAFMIPLVTIASTQPDFLSLYPKLKNVNIVLESVENNWFFILLHELSYGSDFISVELFFRGFLVLAFVKLAGKDAILPMACFYCTIHFGKPLGECISSYFGGILLGIVVYNTHSIVGGLVVHLGIAWLMELGGYLGNNFFN